MVALPFLVKSLFDQLIETFFNLRALLEYGTLMNLSV